MITIKIEEDSKKSLDEMNIKQNNNQYVMTMRDGNELLGLGTMYLFDNFASIELIKIKDAYKDFNLSYGLGKSMLNFIDLKGIRYVVSKNRDIEKLLLALKFKSIDEFENVEEISNENWLYCINLDGYFVSNC